MVISMLFIAYFFHLKYNINVVNVNVDLVFYVVKCYYKCTEKNKSINLAGTLGQSLKQEGDSSSAHVVKTFSVKSGILETHKTSKKISTYPEGSQNDSSDLLLDRLLEDVRQCRHYVVASQILTELRTEGQEPNTEDHLVLELEATLVAQHCRDALMKK